MWASTSGATRRRTRDGRRTSVKPREEFGFLRRSPCHPLVPDGTMPSPTLHRTRSDTSRAHPPPVSSTPVTDVRLRRPPAPAVLRLATGPDLRPRTSSERTPSYFRQPFHSCPPPARAPSDTVAGTIIRHSILISSTSPQVKVSKSNHSRIRYISIVYRMSTPVGR